MATVNKASLRTEFDALKARFESLCAEGKMPPESRALVDALLMLFELLMAVFMEKHTPKSPANSGLPLSEPERRHRAHPSRRQGQGPLTQRRALCQHPHPRERQGTRRRCMRALWRGPHRHRLHRSRAAHSRRHRVREGRAPCRRRNQALPALPHRDPCALPRRMPGPLQYGPGVKAYVVHLLIAQMLSLKRVAQSMHALIGQLLSEATLLGYIAQLHHALAEWERQAIERLLAQPAMHVDETSLRVDRKNHWIHVYSAATLTVKCLHPKRGCEAIEDIGIIPRYGGVAVHDCWASYLSYTHCEHALCGAHLLRELTFIVDAHDYAWAKRMKRLLLDACHEVAKRDEKRLSESEYKAVQKRYRTILTQGERELPPIPPRQKGQRGKVAKSDAHNLWERMKKYEKAVLCFAKHPDVAFTNNRAERDLRMSKVKQKVSGCFRTRKYAEAYCRISSYLQSMANQGYNPLVAIQIALAGRAVDNLPE